MMASFVVVIAAVTLILDISIRNTWEKSINNDLQRLLTQNATSFALRVQNDYEHSPQQLVDEEARSAETRVTIIARNGTVLADSEANAKTMENHGSRPEVKAALEGKTGSSVRESDAAGTEFLYLAVPSGDKIVRLALPLSAIQGHVAQIRQTLLLGTSAATLLALLVAMLVAQNVSRRLRRIVGFAEQVASANLSAPLAEATAHEIAHVALPLDRTARRLEG